MANKIDPLYLFIDTGVFLSFYAFANDDVEQLRKLTKLIKTGKLVLYVPDQVCDEFYRNRETKLAESMAVFQKNQVQKAVPRYMADYPETATFRTAVADMEKARDALVGRATKEAVDKQLAADTLFAEIVAEATVIKVTDDMMLRANRRRLRGNPPGKDSSLGDQINWEALLEAAPEGICLNVVAKDGDYSSKLDNSIRPFLADEWKKRKNGSIVLHPEIKPFLNASFPNIKLAVDVEKQAGVDRLVQSTNFQMTHDAIAALQIYVDALTWDDADTIFKAGLENTQIAWIGTDSDVAAFYRKLMEKFDAKLLDDRKEELRAKFKPDPFEQYAAYAEEMAAIDDDVPF
jgi:hypothetical protein